MAFVSTYGFYSYSEPYNGFWPHPPCWSDAGYYPGVYPVQVVEAHLQQQAVLAQQAMSRAVPNFQTSDVAVWNHMAASAAAMPTATPAQPGNLQATTPLKCNEPVVGTFGSETFQPREYVPESTKFVNFRHKILRARETTGGTERPLSMKIKTATAVEIGNSEEKTKTNKVFIQPHQPNRAANQPTLPMSPAAQELSKAGASILQMVKKKDAASMYLMQQLNITPQQNESKALNCARGSALLRKLQTPTVNAGPRDSKGALLLSMVQKGNKKIGNSKNKKAGNNVRVAAQAPKL